MARISRKSTTDATINHFEIVVNRSADFVNEFVGIGADFVDRFRLSYLRATAHLDKNSLPAYRYTACMFLKFLDELRLAPGHEAFLAALSTDHTTLTRHQWNAILGYLRAELEENGKISWRTKNNKINWLNPLLDQLGIDGVIPPIRRIDIFRHVPDSRPKRSLAEAHAGSLSDAEIERRMQQTAKASGDTLLSRESIKDFLHTLHEEKNFSSDMSTEAILDVLDTRLANLRVAAEATLIEEYAKWEKGQRLIKECSMSGDEIREAILFTTLNARAQRVHNEEYLPSSSIGIGRLLAYCCSFHGGITPSSSFVENGVNVGERFGAVAVRVCGGVINLWPYMHACRDLLAAVDTILLIDLAINADSARGLTRDCIHESNLPGYKEIRWWKGRAIGNEKSFLVPTKDKKYKVGTLRAIEIALETTEVLAANTVLFKDYIFLNYERNTNHTTHDERVCLLSSAATLRRFKQFAASSGAKTAYTRDMIRPSVLLKKALETQDPFAVAELGQHSIDVSQRYITKFPLELLHDRKIRKFIDSMQLVAGDQIEGFSTKVGIDDARYAQLESEFVNTGLGTLCSNGLKKTLGDGSQIACDQIEKCLECPSSEKKIVAEPQNIRDIVHFNRYLAEQRSTMEVDSPKRWTEVWLPWLLYTEVALEKLRERQFRDAYNAGLELAEASAPEFPPLW